MRVVFACVPQTGHIAPLLPLASAMVAQGDEVLFASGPDAEDAVASVGASFRAVGPSFDGWFGALRARTRGIPGDGLAPERIGAYFGPRLFGEIGTALVIDDLVALCREVAPALLVFEPYVFAAPLAAAATGIRPVCHTIGPLLEADVLELIRDSVSPIWREFDLHVPDAAGMHSGDTLTICPPTMDPAAAAVPGARPLRPTALPRADVPPLPVSFAEPDAPLVYLTLGTFSNRDLDLFRTVLDALAPEAVNVLATIGRDNDPAALAPIPPNARVERFIPQAEVLPHCAAAVHHAGAGTMFGALAHGLPVLALPQSADNFIIADLLAAAGAARTIMPVDVTAAAIRAGVRAVLDEPEYRRCARQLAGEIAAMPAPSDVAASLRG